MTSVSLTYSELVRLLKVFVYATLGMAAAIAAVRTLLGASFLAVVLPSISVSILVVTLLLGVLSRASWTSSRFEKWLSRPIVHGLWWGAIRTDYRPAGEASVAPIPIAFVIRQSYFFLSIQSFTKNQPARSTLEALRKDEKTSDAHLSYVFEMRRLAYAENKLTTGYGEMILQDSGRILVGDYWTNSPTQGRLELELVSRDCDDVNSFAVAERKWQEKQALRAKSAPAS